MDISQQLQRAFLRYVVCKISEDKKSLTYEEDNSELGFVTGFTVDCGDDYDDEGRIHSVVDVYIRDRVKFEELGPSYKFTCAFDPEKKNIKGFVHHVITKLDDQADLWGRGL